MWFYANEVLSMHFRLGTLTCQANVNDLLAYVNTSVFPVIQENIRTCVSQGISFPSSMVRNKPEHCFSHMLVIVVIICHVCNDSQISSVLFSGNAFQSPASLSPQNVSQLAPLLPLLGVEFLQQLSPSQLMPAFSVLTSVPFTPTQVWSVSTLNCIIQCVIQSRLGPCFRWAMGSLATINHHLLK